MRNEQRITDFVDELDRYSGGILSRKDDLRFLLELAIVNHEEEGFDRLAFLSKFVAKSRKIMERIGPNGEGYDRISGELSAALGEMEILLKQLTAFADTPERLRFSQTYLAQTPDSLRDLFSLIDDLCWYKNWKIDNRNWTL